MSASLEILELMIASGADPKRVCNKGKYAWVHAMSSRDPAVRYAMVKRLLDLDLPINVRCENNCVLPAAGVLAQENPELIHLFLTHGLDLNQRVRDQTFLELAMETAGPETKKVLENFLASQKA
jgi:hypothetical protein